MTLPRLEAQGLVRQVPLRDARDVSQARYEATQEGMIAFRRWLRTFPAELPALREALHARIDLSQPSDLEPVIEIIDRERLACERECAAARGRLAEARQVAHFRGDNGDWSAVARQIVMVDEALIWAYRAARLQRLHACLEDLRGRDSPIIRNQGGAELAS
jgi:hypothetical protein